MIKNGKGGGKTITGLKFEKRIDLKTVVENLEHYKLEGNIVFHNGEKIAEIYRKNDLYKKLLEPNGIDYKKIVSKKLLPDDAIFVLKGKTLNIIEIKFQEVAGSVDEKLQTCDFKNRQYKKLLSPLGINVRYIYVLNDWFKKPEYKDVLDFVHEVGCYYFFYTIPLDFIGLPTN
ncbi:MAG: hypothetical protein WC821_04300 [archaeon]|jgi:hypothetical protein